jgi:hypothetical protein
MGRSPRKISGRVGGVGVAPLDDPIEEAALVVLDVVAAGHLGHGVDLRVVVGEPKPANSRRVASALATVPGRRLRAICSR